MKNTKARLFTQGLITTILGLVVLGFTGYVIYTEVVVNEVNATETLKATSGWITAGVFLLRVKSTFLTSIYKQFKKETAESKDNGVDIN